MSVTLFLKHPTQFNTHGQSESETQLWQRRLFGPTKHPARSASRDYSAITVMSEDQNHNRRGYCHHSDV